MLKRFQSIKDQLVKDLKEIESHKNDIKATINYFYDRADPKITDKEYYFKRLNHHRNIYRKLKLKEKKLVENIKFIKKIMIYHI